MLENKAQVTRDYLFSSQIGVSKSAYATRDWRFEHEIAFPSADLCCLSDPRRRLFTNRYFSRKLMPTGVQILLVNPDFVLKMRF